VYIKVARIKRGYYEVTPELLVLDPNKTFENEILEKFTKRLEQDIISDPVPWLWSHKRWKHKRASHHATLHAEQETVTV
jgi:KDO2-lipid IV(A) lauroyltransferase